MHNQNIKKIEITEKIVFYYDNATVDEIQGEDKIQDTINKFKNLGFIEIQKGNTLVLLPKEEFPRDIDDLEPPRDVEDLGWNVLERFSHVTRFTKDILAPQRKDQSKEEFQIVHKFSIDSDRFHQEYLEFKKDYPPICQKELEGIMDGNGVYKIKQEEWMEMVFTRGLDEDARQSGWMILLKVFKKWDTSHQERRKILEKKEKSFWDLKQYWQELLSKNSSDARLDSLDEINLVKMENFKYGILKDILRTDRDHEYYQMDSDVSPSSVNPDSESFHSLSRGLQLLFYILMTYAMYNLDLGIFFKINKRICSRNERFAIANSHDPGF